MSTLIIHGTFGRDGDWWRDLSPGSFAGAVADGMRRGGREPDVWTVGGEHVSCFPQLQVTGGHSWLTGNKRPPFEQVAGCFRWSGQDSHGARVDGGKELARYLNVLAEIQPAEPINIIAHSHGGNAVKVASQHVNPGVRFGLIALLATPHFEAPALRDKILYRLNTGLIPLGGGAPPILNVYDASDLVQKGFSDYVTDLTGASPGLPRAKWLFGFEGNPAVNSYRMDPDSQARHLYEDLQVSQGAGQGVLSGLSAHGAVHGAEIGRMVGYWMANWPALSGRDSCAHFGVPLD